MDLISTIPVAYGNKNMFQSGTSSSSDSGALGFYSVLMKAHEPLLESIFWLALGCALGWQDKECVVRSKNSTLSSVMLIQNQER